MKADTNAYATSDTRSNETTSIIVEQKQKEPLITKAYNAFRDRKSKQIDIDNLVPTGAYLDEKQKKSFRDTTLSGLRHAQKLMDSTQVQTADNDAENFTSLPILAAPKLSVPESDVQTKPLGAPVSEAELVSHIQKLQHTNNFTEGYSG